MTLGRRISQSTLGRPIAIATTVALLGVFGAYELIVLTQVIGPRLGEDRLFFQAIGQRWLDGAPVYLPHQLAGPYQVTLQVDNLYPPTALLLFVPLTFLPSFVWWLVPLSVTVYVIATLAAGLVGVAIDGAPLPLAKDDLECAVGKHRHVGRRRGRRWPAVGLASGLFAPETHARTICPRWRA